MEFTGSVLGFQAESLGYEDLGLDAGTRSAGLIVAGKDVAAAGDGPLRFGRWVLAELLVLPWTAAS